MIEDWPENVKVRKNRFAADMKGILSHKIMFHEYDVDFYCEHGEMDYHTENDFTDSLACLGFWYDWKEYLED